MVCSVETMGDECNPVGQKMSYCSKCVAQICEEIVHALAMVKLGISDRGMIALAHRSGELQNIEAHIVYENDEFDYELGLNPKLRHKPAMKNRGEIAWVYAVYRLVSGGFGFEVMSFEDVENHRKKFSKASGKGFSPWSTAWEEMAKKTVIKKALKYAPLQSEFTRAMSEDEHTLDFTADGDDYNIIQQNDYDAENIVDVEADDVEVVDVDPETGEIKE